MHIVFIFSCGRGLTPRWTNVIMTTRFSMTGQLSRIIHNAILESHVSPKMLAKLIGKPYSTLLREVNPHDQGAKLGVETFVEILKITGDISPVEYIANELGLEVVPKKLRKTG